MNCLILGSDEECEGGNAAYPSSSNDQTSEAAAAINGEEDGEGESVFSKLEKTRTMLETSLGLASLLQAYTLIQVTTCTYNLYNGAFN
jgi:hypothetical protein